MYDLGTIEHLRDGRAQFVLCRADKRPSWRGYLKARPGMATIAGHTGDGGILGIIPASLDCSVIDLDHGDPAALREAAAPFAEYLSLSGRGSHLWFGDGSYRRNSNWSALGASGQIRGSNGFVILPHGAERILASGLPSASLHPFPAELVLTAPPLPSAVPAGKGEPGRLDGRSWNLATVQRGLRNAAVYSNLLRWAFRQVRGDDYAAWSGRVEIEALRLNTLLPEPLPHGEVVKTSASAAGRVWSRRRGARHSYDHSPAAQRRRQARQVALRRMWNQERDDRILKAHDNGQSQRQIATAEGVSRGAIRRVLNRTICPVGSLPM